MNLGFCQVCINGPVYPNAYCDDAALSFQQSALAHSNTEHGVHIHW